MGKNKKRCELCGEATTIRKSVLSTSASTAQIRAVEKHIMPQLSSKAVCRDSQNNA